LIPYILFEKRIYILALEMASPGNRHCANCIGSLSFHIVGSARNRMFVFLLKATFGDDDAVITRIRILLFYRLSSCKNWLP